MYSVVIAIISLHLVKGFPSDVHIHLHIAGERDHVEISPGVMNDQYNAPSEHIFESEGPRPIGGWCMGQPDTKECGKNCINKTEICNGICNSKQCLAKNGSACLAMFENGYELSKRLLKVCNGFCTPAHNRCNGKCGEDHSWESSSGRCLNPLLDRAREEIDQGIFPWKDCDKKCVRSEELCNSSCGDEELFCQSQQMRNCLSIEEKNKSGDKIRRGCNSICIPYKDKCGGTCGYAQCEENGLCLDVLKLNQNNTRIRKTCEERCIPWGQDCVFD